MLEDEGAAQREAIAARMRGGDYAGARTLLLGTLQTNPRLEDAFEMLMVLEVLCAAGRAVDGRGAADWYKVLQVLPWDDAAKIDAQYRSIVAHLEVVGGGLPGVELAIRLVDDAYSVLSDPDKRAVFDSRDPASAIKDMAMGAPRDVHAEVQNHRIDVLMKKEACVEGCALLSGGDGLSPCGTNPGVERFRSIETDNNGAADVTNNPPSYFEHVDRSCLDAGNCADIASSSNTKRTDDCFLGDDGTVQLPEYGHIDKKQKSASDKDVHCVSPPQVDFDGCISNNPPGTKEHDHCSSKQYEYHNFENDRAIQNFAAGQIWAAYDWEKLPRRYAQIDKILTNKMQLYVSWFKPCPQSHAENKWSRASLPFVCGTFIVEEHKTSLTCPTMFCHQVPSDCLNHHLEVYPQKGEVWAIYNDWDIGWCSDPEMRKKSSFSAVEILASYSKDAGCTAAHLLKIDGFKSVFQRYLRDGREHLLQVSSDNLLMFSHRIPSFAITQEAGTVLELEHSVVPKNLQHENTLAYVATLSTLPGLHNDMNGFHETSVTQISNPSTSKRDLGSRQQGIMMNNNKLSPEDFVEGQIWAVYDALDRMPRSYVRIIRVVSHTSVFVLKLEPHPMLNEEIRWVEDGLPVACGVFRAGTETIYKDMPEFSHPVECDWSAKRSFYRIFPKKGEVWALYKNWKITLNSAEIGKCEPRMVEILSDYSDESGVNVCSLTRVKGCLSFFHRVLLEDFHLTRWISRSEMLSFSHRVPAFVVVEIKEQDIPRGSWHLEPSALPLRTIN